MCVAARVDTFGARDHLVSQQRKRREAELVAAKVEEFLERWPQYVHDHSVVFALGADPIDIADACVSFQILVHLRFIKQLLLAPSHPLELDRHVLVRPDILPLVQYSEAALAQFLANPKLVGNNNRHRVILHFALHLFDGHAEAMILLIGIALFLLSLR